jgi:hypothetical protein
MNFAIIRSSVWTLAALVVLANGTARAEEAAPVEGERRPALQFALTTEKIRDVKINEEAPGRFIATIMLVDAQKKALSELTGANLGKDLEVAIAGEPVLHQEIRGPMEEISLGPWMNKGLVTLFVRCVTKCGPKKCL